MGEDFELPVPKRFFDLVVLFSVFANTPDRDIRTFTRIFRSVLKPGGRVFCTAFVEEEVPDVTVNPEGYRVQPIGPLHLTRYERSYLLGIFEGAGFEVEQFVHADALDGQSSITLRLSG